MMLTRNEAILKMDNLGAARIPFLFFTNFTGESAWVKPLTELDQDEVAWSFGEINKPNPSSIPFTFEKHPLKFEDFHKAFTQVVHQIKIGNSFLVNLTFKTPITTNFSLQDIFDQSKARYKLRFKDDFVVFSPETFVKMKGGYIYSYPMKGTVDAAAPDAEQQILNDPKEIAEHVTIVDLIRNDISQIAKDVEVTKFRFITEVKTHEKKLLQVSSEIRGRLSADYHSMLGSMLFRLLPAGSITGAPKPETVRIIKETETYERNFYTGICGVFDGENVDTGVMIRFVEKDGDQMYYKSGGGITSFSSAEKEYQEIIDKIYVPL